MKTPIIVPTVFDTSALAKLVLQEPGSDKIHAYIQKHHSAFYVTSWTVGETLGVIKRSWLKKRICKENYWRACDELLHTIYDVGWTVEEVHVHEREVFSECERIARKHNLDVIDATQMVVIKKSMLRFFAGESTPLLVTADEALWSAARAEGFRSWNCLKEDEPKRFETEV